MQECQGTATAEWREAQLETLLPVPYAHLVFTLPDVLAPLALQNPRVVYSCCSVPPAKRCSRSQPHRATWAPVSASWRSSTPGDRTCTIIHTCTVWCLREGSRPMAHAGFA